MECCASNGPRDRSDPLALEEEQTSGADIAAAHGGRPPEALSGAGDMHEILSAPNYRRAIRGAGGNGTGFQRRWRSRSPPEAPAERLS